MVAVLGSMAVDPHLSVVSSRNSSSSSISTVSETSSPVGVADEIELIKHTRQGRDWRPKSTLHLKKRSEYRGWEWITQRALMVDEYHELKPESLDRGPVPKHPVLPEHVYILTRALIAPALQQLSYWYYPEFKWPIYLAYPIYFVCYARFMLACVKRFEHFALKYGTWDEKEIGRDRVPDHSIGQLARGFLLYLFGRTTGEFFLSWNAAEQPYQNFSWSTPLRFFLFLVIFDYFFYVYHRSSHEIDWLWGIHKKHHTTKHPSPVLSILADGIQESLEIALLPLAASLLVPMTFHERYLLFCYTGYVEVYGHSGIRANWELPITGPILKYIGMELAGEDHDLHHRYGKSGRNYGKQTRIWDVVFNTCDERIEMYGQ